MRLSYQASRLASTYPAKIALHHHRRSDGIRTHTVHSLNVLTPAKLVYASLFFILFLEQWSVGREGLEPPESEDDRFTVCYATNYVLPTLIDLYCYTCCATANEC